MRLLRGITALPEFRAGTVSTIGNFDGVHLGHQALLQSLRTTANRLKLPLCVILFEPQPSEYFHKAKAAARLTSLREKLEALKHCQIDFVYCLTFNEQLAVMSANDFAERYFFSLLNVKHLLVGEDFRFGHQRLGDISLLKILGEKKGCQVEIFPNYFLNDCRISSTIIRNALASGDLKQANSLLGRTYSLCGRVIQGDGRGREWGIPTANIQLKRLTLPLSGVFCVTVVRATGAQFQGVANLGLRPSVDGLNLSLEVHLFHFDGNLYGEMLHVFFIQKLRDELKFSSISALIAQIKDDIETAKRRFELMIE